MKLNDVKHNHSLTDLLKILIFSILMTIPFIDVGIRCAYVVCNKNAYQSYGAVNESPYEDIQVDSFTNLKVGATYTFTSANSQTVNNNNSKRIYIDNLNIITCSHQTFTNTFQYATSFTTTWYNNIAYLVPYDDTNTQLGNALDMNSFNIIFTFVLNNQTHTNNTYSENWDNFLSIRQYNNYYTLDNVFDYSVNKLTTSELYTWTQQTAIYTGVQTMCAQLGINNSVIPLLLVYWFILTVVYIIIDIVLKLFTMLTHSIGSKTA